MRYVVFAMGIAAAFSASADIYMLKDGMTDWKSAGSYTNNAIPTLATDVIVTEANATNRILTASARYADAFEMINLYDDQGLSAEVAFSGETTHEDCEILLLRDDEVSAYYGSLRTPVKLPLLPAEDGKTFRGKTTWEELRAKPQSGQRFRFTVRLPCRPSGHIGKPPFALVNVEPNSRFDLCASELILK